MSDTPETTSTTPDRAAGQAAQAAHCNRDSRTTVYLRVGPNGREPLYATAGSAGCDLYLAEDVVLKPGETKVLPLELVMALEQGIEAQIRPRSGLSLNTTLRLANSPGTIDSDYRQAVGVIIENSASLLAVLDQLAQQPQRWTTLQREYQAVTYAAYSGLENLPAALAELPVFLDARGNPYGTVYLSAGERVAQMVLARCLQAEFIPHESPETVGQDRGGGFGSTGRR